MIGISAVIATINRKEELRRLFNSFIANDLACLELIVVDQNLNGLIDDLILEFKNILNIVHLKVKEANQSKARNHGAQYATYPIICFPDDDCWYDDHTLKDVITQFEKNPHIELMIISWKQKQSLLMKSGTFTKPVVLTKKDIYSYKAPISYGTIVLFFKREAFVKIGGAFLETIGIGLYVGAGEDVEMVFRAAKNNLNILYEPNIYVNHKYTPDYKRILTETRSRQRAAGFIYSKYRLPIHVIIRGLFAPLIKAAFSMDLQKRKANYNTFRARVEGALYGIKN